MNGKGALAKFDGSALWLGRTGVTLAMLTASVVYPARDSLASEREMSTCRTMAPHPFFFIVAMTVSVMSYRVICCMAERVRELLCDAVSVVARQ